jgi:hypothetical protein
VRLAGDGMRYGDGLEREAVSGVVDAEDAVLVPTGDEGVVRRALQTAHLPLLICESYQSECSLIAVDCWIA